MNYETPQETIDRLKREKQELLDQIKDKAIEAQAGMWDVEANIFGFIVAASSVIVAVTKTNLLQLGALMALCFSGILLVLGCHRRKKAMYLDTWTLLRGIEEADAGKKKKDDHAAIIQKYEKRAYRVLQASILAFVLFCFTAI